MLAVSLAVGCSGGSIFDDDDDDYRGTPPRHREAKKPNTECFEQFQKVKDKLSGPKTGHQWHHIVNQHDANIAKFTAHDLHCTDNVVLLPVALHQRVSGHFSSKTKDSGAETVRDWLKPKSFDEQYTYGVQVLHDHGIPW